MRFRQDLIDCLCQRRDALFELTAALLCAPAPVSSIPALSLEPGFRCGWGSLYAALTHGRIDRDALAGLLARWRPRGWPLVFAVGTSCWARCDAETSPDRGQDYCPSRHSAGQPIVAGWCSSWIAQLSWENSSWTAPLDVRRLPPHEDTVRVTAGQVTALVARLGADGQLPLCVFDAGYDPIALSCDLARIPVAVLVRLRSDRVFYADPPPRAAGACGRPRRHGSRFAGAEAASWPAPAAQLTVTDDPYGQVEVRAWSGVHPKLAGRGRWAQGAAPPIVSGTVLRVQVEHLPRPTARAVTTLWLWWTGPGTADLDICWRAYVHRFDLEHTLRFAKSPLGWTTPALRHPEQADR